MTGTCMSQCQVYLFVNTCAIKLILDVLVFSQDYKSLFEGAGTNPGEKTLEDKFFEHEVYM